ncbi:MAG: hypothetical protein ACO387_05305 [Flavobacteriaceae bacterium]
MKEERKKRLTQLAIWTWTWVASLALATFGSQFIWPQTSWLVISTILLNLGVGIGMLLANRKLFNHYDELERKIHLESLAFTLGAAVVVGLSYSLIDQTNLIQSDAEIGFLVGFIGLTYMVTLLVNRKRYL